MFLKHEGLLTPWNERNFMGKGEAGTGLGPVYVFLPNFLVVNNLGNWLETGENGFGKVIQGLIKRTRLTCSSNSLNSFHTHLRLG